MPAQMFQASFPNVNNKQHQSYHTQTKLQLKFMNQQKQVVQNIVNKFISRSKKNSIESIGHKAISQKSQQSNESQSNDQEYVILKSDLRSFVQKMALQNYENNIKLEEKQIQFVKLQKQVHKSISQIEYLKQALENKESVLKKKIEEVEAKHNKQKKRRQRLQQQLSWSTNKIKDQLREIQKLKQSFIAKIQPKPQPAYKSSENKQKQQYLTPGKDNIKKLEHLATKNCESIQYSILNSDVAARHQINTKQYNLQNSKQLKTDKNYAFNPIQNIQNKSKESLNTNIQMSRFYRHAQMDEKDRIIKQLAQKSIFLESYIQKLTKKYLGEFIYKEDCQREVEPRQNQQYRQHLKTIDEPSASSLQRTESEVYLSGAFQDQPQL